MDRAADAAGGNPPSSAAALRGWRRFDAALLAAALALAVVLPRAAPGVTFEDAGELSAAAACGGVPHPPGYPLWTALAALLVRGGAWFAVDPARILVLFSAFAAAATCAALAQLARRHGATLATAAAAGLVPLTAPTFLAQALVVEVYALAAALQASLLAVAFAPRPHPRTAALLCGLGLAAHPSTLFLAPLWLLPAVRAARAGGSVAGIAAGSVGAAALGLLPYLYVPLAAARDPAVNWGAAVGGERLLEHLLRRQYAGGDGGEWGARWAFLAEQLVTAWAAVLGPALVCLVLFQRRLHGGPRAAALVTMAAAVAAAAAWWVLPFDLRLEPLAARVAPTYVPAVLCAAVLIALGWSGLERFLAARRPALAPWAAPALLLVGAALPGPATLSWAVDQSRADGAERYLRETLDRCPPGAVLVLSRLGFTDVLSFPLLYGQVALGLRPDVTVIDRALLELDWYREQLARRWPDLAPDLVRLSATLASDPQRFREARDRRLATAEFLQPLFDGPRPVLMVEPPGPNLLRERTAVPRRGLWWIAGDPPADDGEPTWPWLAHQPRSPWTRELQALADELDAARGMR
jgi:hypothetical protein